MWERGQKSGELVPASPASADLVRRRLEFLHFAKLADSLFLSSRPERHPLPRSGGIDAERFALDARTDNRFALIPRRPLPLGSVGMTAERRTG